MEDSQKIGHEEAKKAAEILLQYVEQQKDSTALDVMNTRKWRDLAFKMSVTDGLNDLLVTQRLSAEWKPIKVLLIPKESKSGKPKTYRSLFPLSTSLYEIAVKEVVKSNKDLLLDGLNDLLSLANAFMNEPFYGNLA
ncbi:hypothetical protein QE152_g36100 [Popillia japonica]|uniref:Uncharacterized protein n=1 Tax=Popillia japonica TaxID=7064 RepID=A0AAW1IE05_POPJA